VRPLVCSNCLLTTELLRKLWSGDKCGKRTRECEVIAGRGDSPENSIFQNLLVAQTSRRIPVKVTVKFTPEQATKTEKGSRYVTMLFIQPRL